MGEDRSAPLWFKTVLPLTAQSNICRWQFCKVLLKTNGRCPPGFQSGQAVPSIIFWGTGNFSARGTAPLAGDFASYLPLTVWIWEWIGARSSCLAVLSRDNVPYELHLFQHSCWMLKLQSWCVHPSGCNRLRSHLEPQDQNTSRSLSLLGPVETM